MDAGTDEFERGSEWRQWDLHVHTPASFHWKGPKFDDDMKLAELIRTPDVPETPKGLQARI